MKTVGKLDKYDPYVVIERKKNAFEVLSLHTFLHCLIFVIKHCLYLRETLYKCSDLVSEQIAEIIDSVVGVFNHVMEQGGDYGLISETYVADNYFCNSYRVEDIGLSRTSSDAFVSLIRKFKGLLNHVKLYRITASLACCLLEICIFSCYDFVVMLGKL